MFKMAAVAKALKLFRIPTESLILSVIRRSIHCSCPKKETRTLGMVVFFIKQL